MDEISILVVSNTAYNRKFLSLIGTSIINRCLDAKRCSASVPDRWKMAFDSLVNDNIPVKTTNKHGIRLSQGEVKTVHGEKEM